MNAGESIPQAIDSLKAQLEALKERVEALEAKQVAEPEHSEPPKAE